MNGESTRYVQRAATEQAAYERALRELRRDIGCTWERLSESGELIEALRRRRARQYDDADAAVAACVDELRELVISLSDPQQREPLLVALRMDDRYQERTLTARRHRYNQDLRKTRSDVDTRTLERRENAAIRTLALMLTTDMPAARGAVTGPSDRNEDSTPRWHFLTESRETWYKFGRNRVLREQLMASRLIALVRDASVYRTHFCYRADPRDGVVEIEPVFGCEADGTPYFSDGISFLRLRIPRRLELGEAHDVVLRVRVRSDHECQPRLMTTAGQDEKSMVKHVEFAPDAVPERIWRFAHLTHPGVAHNPRQTLIAGGPHRFIHQSWSGLRIGLCYGITWYWP